MADNSEHKLSTKSEILKTIRLFKGTIFIRGASFLASADDDHRGYNDMGCFIPVSRKGANKFVNDIISSGFEAKGCRMPITISSGIAPCLFLGT